MAGSNTSITSSTRLSYSTSRLIPMKAGISPPIPPIERSCPAAKKNCVHCCRRKRSMPVPRSARPSNWNITAAARQSLLVAISDFHRRLASSPSSADFQSPRAAAVDLVLGHRQLLARPPVGPRPVVETRLVLAEGVEREGEDRGGHAGATAGDDRLVEVDIALCKGGAQALGRRQPPVLDQVLERHVERARHAARAQAGTRLRRLAAE